MITAGVLVALVMVLAVPLLDESKRRLELDGHLVLHPVNRISRRLARDLSCIIVLGHMFGTLARGLLLFMVFKRVIPRAWLVIRCIVTTVASKSASFRRRHFRTEGST